MNKAIIGRKAGMTLGRVNIDNSLIGSLLELLAAVLVLVRRAENGYNLSLGGKGNLRLTVALFARQAGGRR